MKNITKAQRESFIQFYLISAIAGVLFALASSLDSGMEIIPTLAALASMLIIATPLAWIATHFDPIVKNERRVQRLNEEWAAKNH